MNELNVAAYCRVSTDEADQLHSLSAQIKYFTDYISQQAGWRLKEVYYDEGITGTSVKKRAAFNRMIADAEKGEINLILTKEVSRFARNTVDTLQFTRKLTSLKVGVIFMNDGIDTRDKDGELRLTIMASIAQEESRKTSERVKWGIKRKMEDGYVFGVKELLGFKVEKGVLSIVPEEAELVKRIFHTYLYDNKGMFVIANELNAEGILSPKGSTWKSDGIRRVLRNEKYVGDLKQQKHYTTDYLTKEARVNNGELPFYFIKNHHVGIISREIWDAVQEQIDERGAVRAEGHRHSSKHWFSNKVICGNCGRHYSAGAARKDTKTTTPVIPLRCNTRATYGRTERTEVSGHSIGCGNKSINTMIIKTCAKHILEHIQNSKESIVSDLMQEIKLMQMCDKPIDTAKLESEIENLSRKKKKAIDLMLDDLITKKDLQEQTAFYDAEIERLNLEIHNGQNSNAVHHKQIKEIKKCIEEVSGIADTNDIDNEVFYGEMLKHVIVRGNNIVDVYLNCVPFGFRVSYHIFNAARISKYECIVDSISMTE